MSGSLSFIDGQLSKSLNESHSMIRVLEKLLLEIAL